ncbi:unnamed protein product [Discosporangium mesarthrocarpum]
MRKIPPTIKNILANSLWVRTTLCVPSSRSIVLPLEFLCSRQQERERESKRERERDLCIEIRAVKPSSYFAFGSIHSCTSGTTANQATRYGSWSVSIKYP